MMKPSPANHDPLTQSFYAIRQELLAYLRKYVDDPASAEDILQETFVKALNQKQKKPPENLAAWLFRVARNTAIDHLRSHEKRYPHSSELDDFAELSAADDEENIASEALASCLRKFTEHNIPSIYADTLIATQFEGKTLQTLAQESQLSLSAIKSRASRGRKLLKEKLLQCCEIELSRERKVLGYEQKDPNKNCC